MYGNTNLPEFLNLEGMEDHDVNILFFWDKSGKLIATTMMFPALLRKLRTDQLLMLTTGILFVRS